ncbi:MAG TPA: phage tail protein [Thermoanaerobaculia bacterium]|nr:phage tail protein [Thermoanaerobaculia bacterium]
MATGKRIDPYHGYNFEVQIDNTSVGGFRECGGLSFTTDPVEYREGTDVPLHVRKLHGLRKFANITLKRGITKSADLWTWYKNVLNGKDDRRNGAIILHDEQHNPVVRWNFENGWITKWEGPAVNATSNDVALESVEIAVERVELV